MKYVLMLLRDDAYWDSKPREEHPYDQIGAWFGRLMQNGQLAGGAELQSIQTATTVRWVDGRPTVTDGPFMEAKESIGGFAVIDVPDLDAAIAVARDWPAPGHVVEIRPEVVH
jgi:hypothetical protein